MIDPRLKTRRRLRMAVAATVLVVAALAVADRAGAFGYRGDDHARFDRRIVRMIEIIDGDSFLASDVGEVQLLGVDAPTEHWSNEVKTYLEARLENRDVLIKLDGTQTRDDRGRLLAYVYIHDNDCLNLDIVRDAQAFADRRTKHTLRSVMEQAENTARIRKRGMWQELTDDQQPPWRKEWLRSRRRAARG
jgi:endonuclease YncB( thermonuclease family)